MPHPPEWTIVVTGYDECGDWELFDPEGNSVPFRVVSAWEWKEEEREEEPLHSPDAATEQYRWRMAQKLYNEGIIPHPITLPAKWHQLSAEDKENYYKLAVEWLRVS